MRYLSVLLSIRSSHPKLTLQETYLLFWSGLFCDWAWSVLDDLSPKINGDTETYNLAPWLLFCGEIGEGVWMRQDVKEKQEKSICRLSSRGKPERSQYLFYLLIVNLTPGFM